MSRRRLGVPLIATCGVVLFVIGGGLYAYLATAPVAGGLGPDAAASQVPLVASPSHIDVGVVHPGHRAVLTFSVANSGGVSARVLKVQPSCGCSPATVSSETILPGDQIAIHVSYFAGSLGEAAYFVDLITDAGAIRVTFRATVVDPISADPSRVNFGAVAGGSQAARSVKVVASDGKPFNITKIVSDAEAVGCTIREGPGNRSYYFIDVVILPQSRAGQQSGAIAIHTDHPTHSTIVLPVEWHCAGRNRLTPESLFASGSAATEASFRIRYQSPTGAHDRAAAQSVFAVQANVSSDKFAIVRAVGSCGPNNQCFIDITVRLPNQAGYHGSTIRLKSDEFQLDESLALRAFVD